MKAIRYFRPDVMFALTPWHLARECPVCEGDTYLTPYNTGVYEHTTTCPVCMGDGIVAACGYTPPEGWRAEVKERGPRCVECEEMVENDGR